MVVVSVFVFVFHNHVSLRILTITIRICLMNVCAVSVHNVFTTIELKGKGYHKEQSGLSTTGGHSVRAVVNVHVVNSERWLHLWFLMRCEASVCDEQLMNIGGEIALSENTPGRGSRHSIRSRFQSFTRAAISIHDCVQGF